MDRVDMIPQHPVSFDYILQSENIRAFGHALFCNLNKLVSQSNIIV